MSTKGFRIHIRKTTAATRTIRELVHIAIIGYVGMQNVTKSNCFKTHSRPIRNQNLPNEVLMNDLQDFVSILSITYAFY